MTNVPRDLSDQQELVRFISRVAPTPSLFVFLDYDGTLVPLRGRAHLAVMSDSHRNQLRYTAADTSICLIMVSGRDRSFLETQVGDLQIDLAAEHGAFYRDHRKGLWRMLLPKRDRPWLNSAKTLFAAETSAVPGSFVEEKEYSIAWHYRQADPEMAAAALSRLEPELTAVATHSDVDILRGKKVIEVRATEANKGSFLRWYLQYQNKAENRCIIALGDDETDEEMFTVANECNGLTIRVGEGITSAQYRLPGPEHVLDLLSRLTHARDINRGGTD